MIPAHFGMTLMVNSNMLFVVVLLYYNMIFYLLEFSIK